MSRRKRLDNVRRLKGEVIVMGDEKEPCFGLGKQSGGETSYWLRRERECFSAVRSLEDVL